LFVTMRESILRRFNYFIKSSLVNWHSLVPNNGYPCTNSIEIGEGGGRGFVIGAWVMLISMTKGSLTLLFGILPQIILYRFTHSIQGPHTTRDVSIIVFILWHHYRTSIVYLTAVLYYYDSMNTLVYFLLSVYINKYVWKDLYWNERNHKEICVASGAL